MLYFKAMKRLALCALCPLLLLLIPAPALAQEKSDSGAKSAARPANHLNAMQGRMKCIVLVLLAITMILIPSAFAQKGGIMRDRFKNQVNVMSYANRTEAVTFNGKKVPSMLIYRMSMVASFTCNGQDLPCKPPSVGLTFIAITKNWVFTGPREVNLLIDGVPEQLGAAKWDGTVKDSYLPCTEYISVSISPDLLKRMATAHTVEVQIPSFEFKLNNGNIEDLRQTAKFIN